MSLVAKIFAGLAGIIHILFFLMESVFWLNPTVHSIFMVDSVASAEILDVYVKNQGYYNLFLAIGMFAGLLLVNRHHAVGRALVTYICLVMIGAAIVLRFIIPEMTTGPYLQGGAPLIALIALLLSRRKQA